MNYKEKLQTYHWKVKRDRILYRDSQTCQRCGNNHVSMLPTYTGELEKDEIESLEVVDAKGLNTKLVKLNTVDGIKLYLKTYLSNDKLDAKLGLVVTVNLVLRNKIVYPFNGSLINNQRRSILFEENINFIEGVKRHLANRVDFISQDIDKEGFWLVEKKTEGEFCKSVNLHVHHKCYRSGVEIWEQPDNEYLTLCNLCHQIVHDNQLIPYYNEDGEVYQYMKPCLKCGGKGFLECYNYIDNGICYRCDGRGYET